jgi:hypothetical protein
MKRKAVASILLAVALLAAMLPSASAQVSLCTITGQVRNPDGTITVSATLFVYKVQSQSGTIFYKQTKTY